MNVPKLRFKEFTDEWNYEIFDNIIDIRSKSYNPNNNINYKCIELENINQGAGTINGYFNSCEQKSTKNIFYKNEVLFGKLRPYLKKYWYATFDGVCSSEIWVAKSKSSEKITNKFILYIFQTNYFLQLCNLSTGSKMPRADWDFIKEHFFAIPNLKEQDKLVRFLSLLDKKIELQTRKIEALKLFKKGLLNEFLKYHPCNKIPLKYILKERKNYAIKDGILPHVTLSKNGIEEKTERYNRDFLVKTMDKNYKITKLYDLCYNPANLKFGVICLNTYGSAIFSPIYVTFEINREFNPLYIGYYVTQRNFINSVRKYEQGTVYERMAVAPEDFLKINIWVPNKYIQDKFSTILISIDTKLIKENEKLKNFEKLKKGFMQSMFV